MIVELPHCPACGREGTPVTIALHLVDEHYWSVTRGFEWLRNEEESKS